MYVHIWYIYAGKRHIAPYSCIHVITRSGGYTYRPTHLEVIDYIHLWPPTIIHPQDPAWPQLLQTGVPFHHISPKPHPIGKSLGEMGTVCQAIVHLPSWHSLNYIGLNWLYLVICYNSNPAWNRYHPPDPGMLPRLDVPSCWLSRARRWAKVWDETPPGVMAQWDQSPEPSKH